MSLQGKVALVTGSTSGIGLAIAAFSIFFGSRDGLQRAVLALVAGAILFSAPHIVEWVAGVSGAHQAERVLR